MLVFTIILNFLVMNLAFCDDLRDPDELEKLFKKRYMSGFTEWRELRDANETTTSHICSKYIFMISSAIKVVAEGQKNLGVRHPFANTTEPVFALDYLLCNVKLIGRGDELKGTQSHLLAEGDETNTAFKFSLIENGILLHRKLINVWD